MTLERKINVISETIYTVEGVSLMYKPSMVAALSAKILESFHQNLAMHAEKGERPPRLLAITHRASGMVYVIPDETQTDTAFFGTFSYVVE